MDEWISSVSRWTTTNWIMIKHRASGIDPAGTGARVSTLLIRTCLILGAIGVDNTFRMTCWRTSNIALYARAHGLAIYLPALGIWSARWWMAWIWRRFMFNWLTRYESVSICTQGACAHRNVIINFAHCVLCACAWTGINTFASQTSPISGTVRIQYTFRTASRIWIAMVFGQTSASSIVALSIWTTWRGIARIMLNGLLF